MAQRTAQLTGDKSLRKSTVNANIMFTLLEAESVCFPSEAAGNVEFAKMIRHSLPLFGTQVMCAFFRNIRAKAHLLGTKVWPPTDFVPMMYTFFDLISMVFDTVDRCQNCHEPDHPGTCPYFPTTIEPDPAFAGIAAPRGGKRKAGRVSFQTPPAATHAPLRRRARNTGRSQRSPQQQQQQKRTPPPPPSTPPPARCNQGKQCPNQLNGCKYSH